MLIYDLSKIAFRYSKFNIAFGLSPKKAQGCKSKKYFSFC